MALPIEMRRKESAEFAGSVVVAAPDLWRSVREVEMSSIHSLIDPTRALLMDINIRFGQGQLTIESTDGVRITQAAFPCENFGVVPHNIHVDSQAFLRATRFFGKNTNEKLELQSMPSKLLIRSLRNSDEVLLHGSAWNYPDLDKLITPRGNNPIVVDRLIMRKALKSILRESQPIVLIVNSNSNGKLTLEYTKEFFDKLVVEMLDIPIQGCLDTRFGINPLYLSKLFSTVTSSDRLTLEQPRPNGPIIFRKLNTDDFIHLIMPMIIPGEDLTTEKPRRG